VDPATSVRTGEAAPVRITVEVLPRDDVRAPTAPGARPDEPPGASAHARDVDVPEGARLGDLRRSLAVLTGIAEIATPRSPLAVGALAVGEDQLCGQEPLEVGSVLAVGPPRPDPTSTALRAVWHLAVVSGPDAGALLAVEGVVVVGRASTADLRVDDPLVSRQHLSVRPRGDRLQVRDDGSGNGTARQRRDRVHPLSPRIARLAGHRRRTGRWHRLRDADRVAIGSTWIEVRRRDGTTARDRRASQSGGPGVLAPSDTAGRSGVRPPTLTSPTAISTWLTPVVSAAVLALGTGNPRMLLLAATGPVLGLVHLATRPRQARSTRRRPRVLRRGVPRIPRSTPRTPGGAPERSVVVPSPADVVTAAVRLHERHPGAVQVRRLRLTDLSPDACLAVVGPCEQARAVARGLVIAATAPGGADDAPTLVVGHPSEAAPQWAWCRWIGVHEPWVHQQESDVPGPRYGAPSAVAVDRFPHLAELLVIDSTGVRLPAWVSARWRDARAGSQLILVTDRPAAVPPWCRTVLVVEDGRAEARLHGPDGRIHLVPVPGISLRTAEDQARRTAALRARANTADGPRPVPERVPWCVLPGIPHLRVGSGASEIARAWSASSIDPGLSVPLGIGRGGTVVRIDLAADGPHALVAGTTGAGKSALLQTLVLGLAATRSPTELAIAVIDYKGGASLGDCARLPHVVGQVTDLDPGLAMRALAGLRHELRLRERLVAHHGVGDLAQLRVARPAPGTGGSNGPETSSTAPPPRLIVVVDEFRALADDLPDFLPDLLRIAAQGRSLGMHLVLATQRPGGAVSADMRANLALRIALRVTDEADSYDIVGTPDAAAIPADVPGRAVVRRGASPVELVQVAHPDLPADLVGGPSEVTLPVPWGIVPPRATTATVRPGRGGASDAHAATAELVTRSDPRHGSGPSIGAGLSAYVDAVIAAAEETGVARPPAPWLPELPTELPLGDLADPEDGRGLPFGLADLPESLGRGIARLSPGRHLLVVGGPGSGRTTTVRTLAVSGLSAGWHVHAVGLGGRAVEPLAGHPCLGTVVGHDDARRLGRLLHLLSTRDVGGCPVLVVVDGLEAMLDTLDLLGHGRGRAALSSLLRDARSRGVTVAATAAPSPTAHEGFAELVVLRGVDTVARAMLGVPNAFGAPRSPGRAVHLGTAGSDPPRMCQVAVAALPDHAAPPVEQPLRLLAIPLDAPGAAVPACGGEHAWVGGARVGVGVGGDDATEMGLDVSRGALVVGPPGSGRSTALGALARRLAGGAAVHVVTSDAGSLPGDPALASPVGAWSFESAALHGLIDAISRTDRPVVVVVDDLDDLERLRPAELTELAELLTAPSDRGHARSLIASARTARACAAYREPWTSLRANRRGIVLSPGEPGSSEVFGTPLDLYRDHGHPHRPGRGVVQVGPDVVPVQVYRDVGAPPRPRDP
jgi:S-DNA-T family DNA segregation ATPase FtsK/SpoIIIE